MRYIFLLISFIFCSSIMFGQSNIDYIKLELSNIENHLSKKGNHLKLTNTQVEKLTKVLTNKGQRVHYIKSSLMDKDDISAELIKIDNEYDPQVFSILHVDQRIAYQNAIKHK